MVRLIARNIFSFVSKSQRKPCNACSLCGKGTWRSEVLVVGCFQKRPIISFISSPPRQGRLPGMDMVFLYYLPYNHLLLSGCVAYCSCLPGKPLTHYRHLPAYSATMLHLSTKARDADAREMLAVWSSTIISFPNVRAASKAFRVASDCTRPAYAVASGLGALMHLALAPPIFGAKLRG